VELLEDVAMIGVEVTVDDDDVTGLTVDEEEDVTGLAVVNVDVEDDEEEDDVTGLAVVNVEVTPLPVVDAFEDVVVLVLPAGATQSTTYDTVGKFPKVFQLTDSFIAGARLAG
jgi:hypothetical protein